MSNKVYIVGHKNPDNDSIAAAVGLAYLRNQMAKADEADDFEYVPARLGALPPESEWVLESNGLPLPELISDVRASGTGEDAVKQNVILVDHNEVCQAVDGIEEANIMAIVDHHRIGDISTASPILFLNIPVGSTATIVTRMFGMEGIEMPKSIATVLLSAILTDTVILKSPTTTPLDHKQVEYLCGIVGVDATEFGLKIFKCRGGEQDLSIEEYVCADSKEFQTSAGTVLIAQHETVDLESALQREHEAREYMQKLKQDNGYTFVLLLVTDIIAEGSQFVVEGDATLVDKVFGIKAEEGSCWMPGVLSRKKQVAAPILGA